MIFVSYAHEDRARVKALVECLEKSGLDVVWDHEVWAKDGLRDGIEREIARAVRVMVVWTRASAKSTWVRAEADLAAESEKLLQVRLDRVRLPLPFGEYKWFDLLGWNEGSGHHDTEFLELLEELESVTEFAEVLRFSDEAKRILAERRERLRRLRRRWQVLGGALAATLLVGTVVAAHEIMVRSPDETQSTGGAAPTGGTGNSATGGAEFEAAGRASQGGSGSSGASGSGGAATGGNSGSGASGPTPKWCCHATGSRSRCAKPTCAQCGLKDCP